MKVITIASSGSFATEAWATFPFQRFTVGEQNPANTKFTRNVQLVSDGVKIMRSGGVVGFDQAKLIELAVKQEPKLTWPPIISHQPQDDTELFSFGGTMWTKGAGEHDDFYPISTQWELSSDGGVNFGAISNNAIYSGATSGTLVVHNNSGLSGHEYRAKVVNASGTTATDVATLSTLPWCDTVSGGTAAGTASFKFKTAGHGQAPVSFQWQASSDGGVTFDDIGEGAPLTGVNTGTLTVNPTAVYGGYYFRAEITDHFASNFSNAAKLTVI